MLTVDLDELLKPKSENRVHQAEFSQPLCTAIQIALVDVLHSWGVFPSAVIGFSAGEIAAAYASDALTAEEAIINSYYRGLITRKFKGSSYNGGMVAVGLEPQEIGRAHV